MFWIYFSISLTLGLVALFGLLTLILRKTGGMAPGWQVRCTTCDRTRDAAEVGIVRIGAASAGKRTLGWCSGCRRVRAIAIERKPTSPTAS